jgi:hypothetical protein
MGGELRCKGVMLRNRLDLVGVLHGDRAIERTLALIPKEISDPLRYGGVTASAWYPISWLRWLHSAAADATSSGLELARILGREGASKNLTTIHRMLLPVLSPTSVIERSPRVLRTYFDGGEIEVVESTAGRAVSHWKGCRGFDRNIWESMLGGCEAALSLSRAKEVRVRLSKGGGDGAPEAEITAFWQ